MNRVVSRTPEPSAAIGLLALQNGNKPCARAALPFQADAASNRVLGSVEVAGLPVGHSQTVQEPRITVVVCVGFSEEGYGFLAVALAHRLKSGNPELHRLLLRRPAF